MLKLLITEAASHDLDAIVSLIAQDKIDAAYKWLSEVTDKLHLIATSPNIGDAREDLGKDVRCTFFKRYVIFFRQSDDAVEILRVIAGDHDTRRI